MGREYTFMLSVALTAMLAACDGGGGGQGGTGGTTSSGTGGETSAGGTGGGTSAGGNGGDTSAGGTSTGGTGGETSEGGTGGYKEPYPPPPYGYDVGSTIENYGFVGFAAPLIDSTTLSLVQLGDFYNPTGQGTYPAGSPYFEGTAMPKRLLLHVAAVWSGPDNYESDSVIPSVLATYGPCLQVIDILIDGPTPGMPATTKSASNWATKYSTGYPVCIDPAFQLAPVLVDDAFPTNIVIDTQTMTIVAVLSGAPDPGSAFFQDNVASVCP